MKNKPWFWPKSRHFVDSAIMKPKIAVVRHLDIPHNIVVMAVCISKDAAIKIARALNNYEENRRQLRAIAAVVGQLEEIDLLCDTERSRELDSLLKSAPPLRNCDVGTEMEQHERFEAFCHKTLCSECPAYGKPFCGVAWTNAPFAPDKKGKEVDHG